MYIDDFAGSTPEFLPEDFLAGRLEGWGILEGLTGGLQKRYTVNADGIWYADTGILAFTETWVFDDGRSDTLSWRIRKLADRTPGTRRRATAHRPRSISTIGSTGSTSVWRSCAAAPGASVFPSPSPTSPIASPDRNAAPLRSLTLRKPNPENMMADPRELEARFWQSLKSDMTMMVGLDGVEDGHTRPMTAQVEGESLPI